MSIQDWFSQARVAYDEVKAATERAFRTDQIASSSELSRLEDRILMSASPVAVVAGPEGEAAEQDASDTTPEASDVRTAEDTVSLLDQLSEGLASANDAGSANVRSELVILDPGVQNSEQLRELLLAQQQEGRDLRFYVLDADRDGIEQITEILAQHDDLDAVHVLSHGTSQGVQLGDTWLDRQSMNEYAEMIRGWRSAFSVDGDLLLYGCDLAASDAGRSFVDTFADWTHTDVAASTDLTGAAAFGGDWDLEYQVGSIETEVAAESQVQQDWIGLMSVAVDSVSTGTSTGGNFSISHTTSGGDRLMLVGISLNQFSSESVSSVTYNGVNLTHVGSREAGDAVVEIWSLVTPDLGTHNVVVNFTASTDGNSVGVMTFTGVDQANPLGTFASNSAFGTNNASVAVSSAVGERVFGVISVDDPSYRVLTEGAGQTEHWELHAYQVTGGGSTAAGAASVNMSWTWSAPDNWAAAGVSIKPVTNTAPTISLPGGAVNYTENNPATILDAAATASDSDSANLSGGTLTVDFTANGTANDRLAIRNQGTGTGQIGVSGSNVTYAGTIIGTFTGGTDGASPLVITLNANATPTAAQALMRNITYHNVSENLSTGARTVRFVLTDGDGGTSNTATKTVNVTAQNDAPIITSDGGGATAAINVQENASLATIVTSSDVDGAAPVYNISGGADASKFAINSSSGVLTFITPPDYEVPTDVGGNNVYEVTVSVSDGTLTDSQTISVTVTDTSERVIVGNSSSSLTTGSSLNWSHTVDSGSHGMLIVSLAYKSKNASVTSVTYGGTALTLLGGTTFSGGDNTRAEIWYLKLPATGTANVVVNMDASSDFVAGATNYYNVDQTASFGSLVGATGSGGTPTVTVASTTDELVIDVLAQRAANTGVVGANQAEAFQQSTGGGGSNQWGSSSSEAGAASVTMSWNMSGGTEWALTAVALKPHVNVPPSIALPGGALIYSENDPASVIDATAALSDTDSIDFDSGTLTIDFTSNSTANDRLTIRNQGSGAGQIGVSGSNVTYAGTTIGTFTGGTDGSTPLLISFNANSTPAAVQALMRNIAYLNVSETPSELTRTVRFVVTDGDDGTSNAATQSIQVTAVNDVPVATANTVTTSEDNAYTFSVSDFTFTDVEGDSLVSVTITNQSLAGGMLRLSGVTVNNGDTILAGQIASLVYTPATNANGSPLATFDFTVNDSGSGVSSAQMDIDVTAVNDVPVATANTVTTSEDNAYTFSASDFTFTDVEGDSLVSVTITNQSLAGGMLRLSGVTVNNGDTILAGQIASLVYTPATNANGSPLATFDFTVNDSGSGVSSAQMDIDVTAVNDVPVATANTVTTSEDIAYTFAAGDFTFSDTEGDSLVSVTITNQSLAGGTLRLSGVTVNNGDTILAGQIASLVYTPAANANGAPLATFDFTVNDSGSGVSSAQMDIDVTAVNDVPVATANTVTTPEDIAYTFAAGDFTFSDTEGDSLVSVTITNQSLAGGTLRLSGVTVNNGDTILAGQIASLVYTPAANANGAPLATFDFTVNDSGSGVSSAQMDIDVTAVNDVPMAMANTVTTTEDNAYTFAAGDFTFSDVEGDSLVSVTITNQSLAGGTLRLSGVTVNNGDTILAGQIASLVYTPAANANGSPLATFDFTVNDSGSGVSSAQMDIDVTAVNDVPVATANTVTTSEDIAYTFVAGDFTFSDTEGDSLVSVTITNQSLAGGTLRLSGVTVNNGDTILAGQIASLVYTPAANANGTPLATFDFTVNDSGSGVSSAQMDINVTAVNDVPVATANTVTTPEDIAYTFAAGDFTFSDVEGDSLVSVTITNQSLAGGTLRLSGVTVNNGDTILAGQIASLVYTPAANANGTPLATFDFTVNDSGSGVSSAQMDINVTAVNDVPMAMANTVTTSEDIAYTFAAGDFTFSDTEGDSLVSVTITNQSLAGGTLRLSGVTVNNGDTILAGQIANLVYTPAANANGSPLATFDFTVNDSGSGVSSAQMDIDVTAVNDVPIGQPDDYTVDNDSSLIVSSPGILGNDTDLEGATLTATLVAGPTGGAFSFATDGSFVYTPTIGFSGTDTFVYIVSDGADVSSPTTVTITVNDVLGTPSPGSENGNPDSEPLEESEEDDDAEVTSVVNVSELPAVDEASHSQSVVRAVSFQLTPEGFGSEETTEVLAETDVDSGGTYGRSLSAAFREQLTTDYQNRDSVYSTTTLVFQSGSLFHQLDSVINDLENHRHSFELVAGTTIVASGAISVGAVAWAARASYFIAMLSSSMPAWSMIDPVAVLDAEALAKRSDKRIARRDTKSLADLVDEKQA